MRVMINQLNQNALTRYKLEHLSLKSHQIIASIIRLLYCCKQTSKIHQIC